MAYKQPFIPEDYLKLIINSGATTKLIVCKCTATDADLENIYNNNHIYF